MESAAHPLDDVLDRARGALVGFAVGDALGATVEFMTPGEVRAAYGIHREIVGGGWLRLSPGAVTDDTQMSLCVARAILQGGAFDPRTAADHLVGWLRSRPLDVGNTCRRGLRRYMLDGSLEGPQSDGDAGNGGAMRIVPVALATLGSDAALQHAAVGQARLTHHHPLSDAASTLFGRLVQLACRGRSLRQLRRVADDAVAAQPAFRFTPYAGLSSAYVVDTVRTVLHHVFSAGSFEECLVAVVNRGGDADTAGAIAGAICGAYHGFADIPPRWLKKLDRGLLRELSEVSAALVRLSPLARASEAKDA